MKVAGFFSGVGGIELGFEMAGFDIVFSNEIDLKASQTYSLNHKTDITIDDIKNLKSDNIPYSDIIVGGFPCQAFSIAGYQKGFEDERAETFFHLAKIIRDKKPRVVFIKNVKNLLTHDKGNTFNIISNTLNSYGYKIKHMILNSSKYANIPQNRERIYIIGFLNQLDYDNFEDIKPIELETRISDIVDYDKKVDDIYYYTKQNCNFYDELKEKVIDKNTVYQYRRVYIRENKSNLCPTLTANMGTGGHNVPIVLTKYGIRKLTPKECFLFQGYPSNFKLPNIAKSHLYKQAGNSVVVPIIKRLAKQIKDAINKTDEMLSKNG